MKRRQIWSSICRYDTDKKTDNQSIVEIIANAENHVQAQAKERSSIRSKITDLIMNTLFEKSASLGGGTFDKNARH